tara:strand:+ start:283 stop:453 length:171 start_codon:yes stop_codon:yes gene_type:complete
LAKKRGKCEGAENREKKKRACNCRNDAYNIEPKIDEILKNRKCQRSVQKESIISEN